MTKAPIIASSDSEIFFEVDSDASNVGIRAVLNQNGHPNTLFSMKLEDGKKN